MPFTRWLLVMHLCLSGFGRIQAQVHLHFKLAQITDSVFFAGNINGWNPADPKYAFSPDGELHLTVEANKTLLYKFTRGTWDRVECTAAGADVDNRELTAIRDTTILVRIESWRTGKKHTASINVSVLDTAFAIPQLNRVRPVRIYLPPDYHKSNKRYPVLYMQDAQNCFDEFTGGFGEWHVDETLDHFYDSCRRSMIVVAVDHGGDHRLTEYNPYDHPSFGKGEGIPYTDFLVHRLKPFIDSSFRTLPKKGSTAIAGSSMGGLISMYAILAYPEIFGFSGVFSPAFWTAPALNEFAASRQSKLDGAHIFFYAGGKESKGMLPEMQAVETIISANKKAVIKTVIDENARHNEAAWTKWFPVFLQWMMGGVKQDK